MTISHWQTTRTVYEQHLNRCLSKAIVESCTLRYTLMPPNTSNSGYFRFLNRGNALLSATTLDELAGGGRQDLRTRRAVAEWEGHLERAVTHLPDVDRCIIIHGQMQCHRDSGGRAAASRHRAPGLESQRYYCLPDRVLSVRKRDSLVKP